MALVLLFNQYEAPVTGVGAGVVDVITGVGSGTVLWPPQPQPPQPQPAGNGTPTFLTLRTYGRINGVWIEVTTDENGDSSQVYLTAVCQSLKLNLGESPFYANYGIPAQQSVITGVFPDYYAIQTQNQWAPFFASLVITRVQGSFPPAYNVKAVTHAGAILQAGPIPT